MQRREEGVGFYLHFPICFHCLLSVKFAFPFDLFELWQYREWISGGLGFESQQRQGLTLLHLVQPGSEIHPTVYAMVSEIFALVLCAVHNLSVIPWA